MNPFTFLLHIIHICYTLIIRISLFWKQLSNSPPQLLRAPRHRIPTHLSIVFVVGQPLSGENAQRIIIESVLNVINWCRTIGIQKLTIYEETDMLSRCLPSFRDVFPISRHEIETSESDTEFPITPPPSDYSDSRPLSPSHDEVGHIPVTTMKIADLSEKVIEFSTLKRHQYHSKTLSQLPHKHYSGPIECFSKSDLLVCVVSRESSKPAIAAVSSAIALTHSRRLRKGRLNKSQTYRLTVEEFDRSLEDDTGLSSPDFMIIHPLYASWRFPITPELYGFPPWQIKLTEIYLNNSPKWYWGKWLFSKSPSTSSIDENSFRMSLDEYASAEMRFGK